MAACRKLFLSFLMQIHPPTFVKNNAAEIFVWQNTKLKYLCKIFSQSVYAGCSKDRTSQHSDSRSSLQHPFVKGLQCWSSLIQLRDSAGFTPDFPIKPRIIDPTSTQFQIFIFCFQWTCHLSLQYRDRKHGCRHPSGTTLKGLSWVEFAGYDWTCRK